METWERQLQIFLKLEEGAAGGTERRNFRLKGHLLSGQSRPICLFALACFMGLKNADCEQVKTRQGEQEKRQESLCSNVGGQSTEAEAKGPARPLLQCPFLRGTRYAGMPALPQPLQDPSPPISG